MLTSPQSALKTNLEWFYHPLLTHLMTQVISTELKTDVTLTYTESFSGTGFKINLSEDLIGGLNIAFNAKLIKELKKDTRLPTPSYLLEKLTQEFKNQLSKEFFYETSLSKAEETPLDIKNVFVLKTPIGEIYLNLEIENLSKLLENIEPTERKIRIDQTLIDLLYAQTCKLEEAENSKKRSVVKNEIKLLKRMFKSVYYEKLNSLILPIEKVIASESKKHNKSIQFEVMGQEIAIHKKIINHLYTPLFELIKNSIQHGIEKSSVREKNNKISSGKIICQFALSDHSLHITLSDDGKGFDILNIKKSLIEQNQENPSEKEPTELINYLLQHPTSIFNETSGISKAMSELKKIQGNLKILYTSHEGVSFVITAPLEVETKNISPSIYTSEDAENIYEDSQILLEEFDKLLQKFKLESNENTRKLLLEMIENLSNLQSSIESLNLFALKNIPLYCKDLCKYLLNLNYQEKNTFIPFLENAFFTVKENLYLFKINKQLHSDELVHQESRLLWTLWKVHRNPTLENLPFQKTIQTLICKNDTTEYLKDFNFLPTKKIITSFELKGNKTGFLALALDNEHITHFITPLFFGTKKELPWKENLSVLFDFISILLKRHQKHLTTLEISAKNPALWFGNLDCLKDFIIPHFLVGFSHSKIVFMGSTHKYEERILIKSPPLQVLSDNFKQVLNNLFQLQPEHWNTESAIEPFDTFGISFTARHEQNYFINLSFPKSFIKKYLYWKKDSLEIDFLNKLKNDFELSSGILLNAPLFRMGKMNLKHWPLILADKRHSVKVSQGHIHLDVGLLKFI